MLSLPQKIDDRSKRWNCMWDGSHVVDLGIVMAVTNHEIEQLNFTFLERYLSAQSHWLKYSTAGYIWRCKNLYKWWKQPSFLLVNDEIITSWRGCLPENISLMKTTLNIDKWWQWPSLYLKLWQQPSVLSADEENNGVYVWY
jgi:hypothetical protein